MAIDSGAVVDVSPELILDIGGFPDRFWVLHQSDNSEKYLAYSYNGVLGLACFESEASAGSFALLNGLPAKAQEVSFDDARDIVKSKMELSVLYLLDDINNPVIYNVK